jgi:hypothetical protein
MSLLRKLLWSETPSVGPATGRHAVDDGAGHIFDVTACPYCGAEWSPLPKRSGAKCKSCAEKVGIDRTLDGICTLVRDGEGIAERDWQERGAAMSENYEHRTGPLRDYYRRQLARYASLGLWVSIRLGSNGCRSCRKLQGVYWPQNAPTLPNPDCHSDNRICFCEYRPVMPAPPR